MGVTDVTTRAVVASGQESRLDTTNLRMHRMLQEIVVKNLLFLVHTGTIDPALYT